MKITAESHVDHDLTPEQKDWLESWFAEKNEFFIATV